MVVVVVVLLGEVERKGKEGGERKRVVVVGRDKGNKETDSN